MTALMNNSRTIMHSGFITRTAGPGGKEESVIGRLQSAAIGWHLLCVFPSACRGNDLALNEGFVCPKFL